MAIYDISVPIHPGMVIYRGNPGVRFERKLSLDDGDGANVSELTLGAHTGTHVDGPLHFFNDGAGADSLPLEAMVGRVEVVEIPDPGEAIDAETLRSLPIPADAKRVILKTPNSSLWDLDEFTHDFVRLDRSGALHVIELGLELIGIDYLSIGDHDAHVELLSRGIVALEGLDLRAVEPGAYELICLPLKLIGTDGAPSRVILRDLSKLSDRGDPGAA